MFNQIIKVSNFHIRMLFIPHKQEQLELRGGRYMLKALSFKYGFIYWSTIKINKTKVWITTNGIIPFLLLSSTIASSSSPKWYGGLNYCQKGKFRRIQEIDVPHYHTHHLIYWFSSNYDPYLRTFENKIKILHKLAQQQWTFDLNKTTMTLNLQSQQNNYNNNRNNIKSSYSKTTITLNFKYLSNNSNIIDIIMEKVFTYLKHHERVKEMSFGIIFEFPYSSFIWVSLF